MMSQLHLISIIRVHSVNKSVKENTEKSFYCDGRKNASPRFDNDCYRKIPLKLNFGSTAAAILLTYLNLNLKFFDWCIIYN